MNRIVFGSANHWTSPYQVGSHAWARLFATHGWSVAYLSDPVTPWHWFSRTNRERTRERFALWKTEATLSVGGTIRAWNPCSLVSPRDIPFFRSRWVLRHWHQLAFPSPCRQTSLWGFDRPNILWLDSVRHAEWGRSLRPENVVLRVADWQAGMPEVPASALQLERELIAASDRVIAASEALAERLKPLRGGRPLATIRNGVDVAFWQQPDPLPEEYKEIPSPRVVYVGALDQWFDLQLVTALGAALPDVHFVLVGQRRFDLPAPLPSNLHWLGSRPREKARGYVQHAQAGIIPFKRNELIECVCPLKLYEYMACGLPVVATRWEELERMNSPALLATGADEWTRHLRTALESGKRNSQQLKAYAEDNDWEKRWQTWQAS
jgi:glycosyltransferase involved in cell wall biosynthesis